MISVIDREGTNKLRLIDSTIEFIGHGLIQIYLRTIPIVKKLKKKSGLYDSCETGIILGRWPL